MRNPARLDEFYDRLKEAHKQFYDMRISQIWMNVLGQYVSEHNRDPFYVEDDEFVSAFEKIVKKWSGK